MFGNARGKGYAVKIRGFVLGVVLLALVGWCMVQESFKQTQARYRLAELGRTEDEAKKRLGKLRTKEQELRSPASLMALAHENRLKLLSLGYINTAKPVEERERRPGEVLERPSREMAEGESPEEHRTIATVRPR